MALQYVIPRRHRGRRAEEIRFVAYEFPKEWQELLIVVPSDFHKGDPRFHEPFFLDTLDYIKTIEQCYAILGGDLLDLAIRHSLGDVFAQEGTPQDHLEYMIENLMGIRDKILGVTDGNHEDRIYRDTGINVGKLIADALGVPYRTEGIGIKLSVGRGNSRHKDKPFVYYGYCTHGYGGARTRGAKAIKVERTAHYVQADAYWMAHDHVKNVADDVMLIPDSRTSRRKGEQFKNPYFRGSGLYHALEKKLIKTNAYVKWGGYAERGGFPPTSLTTPITRFYGINRHGVDVIS